jgi:ribosomal-protein-alanine N-acetyltransferase
MPDNIELRLATVAETKQLAAMSRDLVEQGLGWSWTPSRIVRHIRSPDSIVLVAQSQGQIIGFAIMHFSEEEAHLDLLAVNPKYQRTGIGRQLIEWLEKSALVAGISIIYLEVRTKNKDARMFYERLGYSRIRHVHGYYSGRESAVCMAIDLCYSRCSTDT